MRCSRVSANGGRVPNRLLKGDWWNLRTTPERSTGVRTALGRTTFQTVWLRGVRAFVVFAQMKYIDVTGFEPPARHADLCFLAGFCRGCFSG
jgi:hypothetical protein